jgi:hypothetical protein
MFKYCWFLIVINLFSILEASALEQYDFNNIIKPNIKAIAKNSKVPISILYTIAKIESYGYPWTINVCGKGYFFKNKNNAIKFINNLLQNNINNFDVGVMQINYKYHKDAFKNIEEMIEPSYNINYAAKLIKSHYIEKKDWLEAVGSYHSKTVHLKDKYIYKFSKEFIKLQGI